MIGLHSVRNLVGTTMVVSNDQRPQDLVGYDGQPTRFRALGTVSVNPWVIPQSKKITCFTECDDYVIFVLTASLRPHCDLLPRCRIEQGGGLGLAGFDFFCPMGKKLDQSI
jgi:hypothetical protein